MSDPIIYDPKKIGTLIIGFYRCGTHYLADNIIDVNPDVDIHNRYEICNNNTIDELVSISNTCQKYNVAILNNCVPKFYLTSATELLKKWHVINLSRKDKVSHYISHYLWMIGREIEDQNQPGIFDHHGTSNRTYKQHLKDPIYHPIDYVVIWLQQQLINKYIPHDCSIDYKDLQYLPTYHINWQPNDYRDITLSSLFTNHQEIQNLLENFHLR